VTHKFRCIAFTFLALVAAIPSIAAEADLVEDSLIYFESQTWWKGVSGPIDVLTSERAEGYNHVHVRTAAPAFAPLPLGTTFVPTLTTILHNVYGYVKTVKSPLTSIPNGGADRTSWPVPPATGEHELVDTRTYPPYAIPDGQKGLQIEVSLRDTTDKRFNRHTRLNFKLGTGPFTGGLKAQSWLGLKGDGPGQRGYLNVNLSSLSIPHAPVSGVWSIRFSMWESSGRHAHNGSVLIDPNFHSADPAQRLGQVVWQNTNMWGSDPWTVSIDTTTLTNGWHRLAIIADDEGQTSEGALACVLVLWFEVQN
jgi:hypothetical protein